MSTGGGDEAALREQIDQLKQQLAHAQRLTALGELVSTTTHEFNNVLMTIINYAKLGLRAPGHEPARTEALEKILKGSAILCSRFLPVFLDRIPT